MPTRATARKIAKAAASATRVRSFQSLIGASWKPTPRTVWITCGGSRACARR